MPGPMTASQFRRTRFTQGIVPAVAPVRQISSGHGAVSISFLLAGMVLSRSKAGRK